MAPPPRAGGAAVIRRHRPWSPPATDRPSPAGHRTRRADAYSGSGKAARARQGGAWYAPARAHAAGGPPGRGSEWAGATRPGRPPRAAPYASGGPATAPLPPTAFRFGP